MNWNLLSAKSALMTLCGILLSLVTVQTSAEPIRKTSLRPDGSTIHWSVEHPENGKKRGLLVIAQGSGCLSAIQNPTVAQAQSLAPGFSTLMVEKYGVTHDDKPENPMSDCSEEYFAHHTVSQRADDVAQLIGELKESDWWNGELVLFGGSEGGAVVARLTPRLQPDAVVVFSSGLGEPLAESIKGVIPPFAVKEAETKLQEARENPESSTVWGGNSYRWWADVMDDVLVNEMLKTQVPVLLIQGGRDQFAPVESARAARDAYAAANNCRLTYWEYEDYDHFMADSAGVGHRNEVFAKISQWLSHATSGRFAKCP